LVPAGGKGLKQQRAGRRPCQGRRPAWLNSVTKRVLGMLDDEIIPAQDLLL
jgi:hypothetical protein